MTHITDNQDALLDYLYEEGDPAERIKVARHLQECAQCSVAVLELRSVRGLLSEWTPPAVSGFKVVRTGQEDPAAVPSATSGRRWGAGWSTWAQAAAAVVLFASGVAVSQLRVEYGNGVLTVHTRAAQPQQAAVVPASPATDDAPVIHNGSNIFLPVSDQLSSGRADSDEATADVLRRVKALIDQSESRQQRELALRLSDLVRDFDAQRQADMHRVDQNLGQLEGQTGAEVARQRELLNSLQVKVSQGQ